MGHDYYENSILFILRQEPTNAYKIEQIRIAIVGSDFTPEGMEMHPVIRQQKYNMIDDALKRLIQRDEVYKKDDNSGNTVYGIKRPWREKASHRIGWPDARRRLHRFRVWINRRVKGIHPNWLILCSIVVAVAVAVAGITASFLLR